MCLPEGLVWSGGVICLPSLSITLNVLLQCGGVKDAAVTVAEPHVADDCYPKANVRPAAILSLLVLLALPARMMGQSVLAPAKGRFLVATKSLLDPNFRETVILLLDYSATGAMGLVINRPTEFTIAQALPELDQLGESTDPVHLGGPVQVQQVTILLRADSRPHGAYDVFDDVWVLTSQTSMDHMAPEEGKYRVFAGYSGWGGGQLDAELRRGSWYVVDAQADLVFSTPIPEIWPQMIRLGTAPLARLDRDQPTLAR